MSDEERDIEVIDGGISVIMRGDAAERFLSMADGKGMTVEQLSEKLVRDALAKGML